MTIPDELWRLLGPVLLTCIATIAGGLLGQRHERMKLKKIIDELMESEATFRSRINREMSLYGEVFMDKEGNILHRDRLRKEPSE